MSPQSATIRLVLAICPIFSNLKEGEKKDFTGRA
jgi:hypothetical protein